MDCDERSDATALDYLGRVRAPARMGRLIDDLLKLSRLTRSDMRLESVLWRLAARSPRGSAQGDPPRQVEVVIQSRRWRRRGDRRLLCEPTYGERPAGHDAVD